jgi:hypothetical protein
MSQRRRQDLVSRVVDDEILILDRAAGRVHRLNRTASYVWSACDGRSASEVASEMAAHFDITSDTVLSDVETTLVNFRRLGLLLHASGERMQGD